MSFDKKCSFGEVIKYIIVQSPTQGPTPPKVMSSIHTLNNINRALTDCI